MGKASTLKRQRRIVARTAEFGVFCPGFLDVLSIGKGDLKLVIDSGHPEDVEKARKLIEEMLAKGYSIYVETDRGPTRVKKFNPKRLTYMIVDEPEEPKAAPAKPGRPRRATKEIPVAGSRATAVGRTAGG